MGRPPQAGHAALVSSLQREEAAAEKVRKLERQLAGMKAQASLQAMDTQRARMIVRLRDEKIAHLQVRDGMDGNP